MTSIALVTSTNAVYNFDPITNEVRYVFSLPREMTDIDFDAEGNMYGVGSDGDLYSVDVPSGDIENLQYLSYWANALEMFDGEGASFGGFFAETISGEITIFDENDDETFGGDFATRSAGDLEGMGDALFWTSTDGYLNRFDLNTGALTNYWSVGRDDMDGLADDGTNLHIFAGKDHYSFNLVSNPVYEGSLTISGDVTGAASLPVYQLAAGNTQFGGTPFDDAVTGSSGNNTINGDVGNDSLIAGDGDDVVRGGRGDDTISGQEGDDELRGGLGADLITGDDTITEGGNDSIFGDRGDDLIFAGGGADRAYGGSGDDSMFGEAGTDTMIGDAGADTMDGGADIDRLYGGTGDDMLLGGSGADLLAGSNGADTFDGGTGNDRLFASRDGLKDTFIFGEDSGSDRIFVFEDDIDEIHIASSHGFTTVQEILDTATVNAIGTINLNLGSGNAVQIYRFDSYNPGATVQDLADDIVIV